MEGYLTLIFLENQCHTCMSLSEESLGIILGVPSEGTRSVEGCKPSSEYVQRATKYGDMKCVGLLNKFLKEEYQIFFEFINKVLLPQSEKRTVASATDLFLIEKLDELETISLPGFMLEHMRRIMTWKNAKHGIPNGYLLNHVFEHFGAFWQGSCRDEGKVKTKSRVSELLEKQDTLKRELEDFTTFLSAKDAEIARLRALLQQAQSEGPGTSSKTKEEVDKLRVDNAQLLESNASLSEEVKPLTEKLLQAHADANLRLNLVLQSFSPRPPPS
ncbi:hypothetical protein KY285_026273 [Solanum tuberosum]|nr:hypothetical protein KY285_026273 [Solanum tuberosum]